MSLDKGTEEINQEIETTSPERGKGVPADNISLFLKQPRCWLLSARVLRLDQPDRCVRNPDCVFQLADRLSSTSLG